MAFHDEDVPTLGSWEVEWREMSGLSMINRDSGDRINVYWDIDGADVPKGTGYTVEYIKSESIDDEHPSEDPSKVLDRIREIQEDNSQ